MMPLGAATPTGTCTGRGPRLLKLPQTRVAQNHRLRHVSSSRGDGFGVLRLAEE